MTSDLCYEGTFQQCIIDISPELARRRQLAIENRECWWSSDFTWSPGLSPVRSLGSPGAPWVTWTHLVQLIILLTKQAVSYDQGDLSQSDCNYSSPPAHVFPVNSPVIFSFPTFLKTIFTKLRKQFTRTQQYRLHANAVKASSTEQGIIHKL